MTIAPDVAGPRQWVNARCDGSINFLQVPASAIRVLMTAIPRGPVYGHVSYYASGVRVIDHRTISFQVLAVGRPGPARMPPDVYRVAVMAPGWAGRGEPLQVVEQAPSAGLYLYSSMSSGLRGLVAPWWTTFRNGAWAAGPIRALGAAFGAPGLSAFTGLARASGMATPPILGMLSMAALSALRVELRDEARARQDALFGAGAPAPDSSVELLLDGVANFAAIKQLIADARSFIYITSLGFDELTGIGVAGPGQPTALGQALLDAIKAQPPEQLDVKVLVFEPPSLVDKDGWLEHHFTNVRTMSAFTKPWGDVRRAGSSPGTFDPVATRALLRLQTHAPDWMLNAFVQAYQNASIPDATQVWFPTGIQVAQVDHDPRWVFGGHHQKMVITEHGAWIGGLNLQKHYWDRPVHHHRDPTRRHSGEGRDPTPVPPLVLPWHDTGLLVHGAMIADALALFALRWDGAVQANGAYAAICELLAGQGVDPLINRLRGSRQEISESRVARHRRGTPPTGHDPALDLTPGPEMIERAALAATLPGGTGYADAPVTDIRDLYERCIEQLDEQGSFAYFENQYFTHRQLVAALHDRWRRNAIASTEPHERFPPFAYVVLPYVPQPNIDWDAGPIKVTFEEMQLLKWLEVKTARKVMERDPQTHRWVYAWGVERPENDVVVVDSNRFDPFGLNAPPTTFTVIGAYPLHPDSGERISGGTAETKQFSIKDVLTVSDIMAYTLVSRETPGTRITTSRVGFPDPALDRLHNFLLRYHIYAHAKVACLNSARDAAGRERCWATVGSANLNPRSLDEEGDTELNVFMRDDTRVPQLREVMWQHLFGRQVGTSGFADLAMENLNAIMAGDGTQLEGLVVRLDVVARAAKVDWF